MAVKTITRPDSAPQVRGPYWVFETPEGSHRICGRHGATVRVYPKEAGAAAEEDCRRLQAAHRKREAAIHDAAHAMLDELETVASGLHMLIRAIEEGDPRNELRVRADDMLRETKAMIAKARGAS